MKRKSLWKSKYLNEDGNYTSISSDMYETYRDDRFDTDDFFAKESDENKSKDLLIDIMMKRYGITKEDMKDITIVKSKLRDINIEEILK